MILMSNLNRTKIDLPRETAWIQTGVSLGQLYYEIQTKSSVHAFPAGLYPSVGSGGHISGGGIGTLTRKYGLASDNVLDARIINVNGTILDRKGMGEDLFWALRGGGGSSFGVILAWKLRLVRVPPEVTAFSVRRRLEFDKLENLGLLEKWQGNAYRAPDELFVRLLVQTAPDDDSGEKKFVQVTYNGLFLGPAERFVHLVNRTFPEFNFTVGDCLNRPENNNNGCPNRPCVKKECFKVSWIQSVLYFSGKKPDDPPEILLQKKANMFNFHKGTSDFLKAPVPAEGWRMVHDAMLREEQPMIIIDPLGGKMDRISEDKTPFPHRKGNLFNVQYLTYWWVNNNESEANKHLKWMRDLREKTKPYVAKSPRTAYINYKDLDLGSNDANFSYSQGKVWGEKYFKDNFERLARVKGKVDPSNFFRNELSIPVLLQ
ncbi:FAD-binding Berberine family protein [Striga hermonthica]|uniref:FAD-binding Berberine family protein n=1 Tax=Striga hermonthica TaxID=68872 RepID=A0A9N7RE37_STRHE|nr:FAD-binding Berberine family protein [Striga hermonthica]